MNLELSPTSSPRQVFPLASSSTPGDDSCSLLVSYDFIILKTWSPRSPYTPVLSQKKVKARGTVCGRCSWTRSRRGAHHFCLLPIPRAQSRPQVSAGGLGNVVWLRAQEEGKWWAAHHSLTGRSCCMPCECARGLSSGWKTGEILSSW